MELQAGFLGQPLELAIEALEQIVERESAWLSPDNAGIEPRHLQQTIEHAGQSAQAVSQGLDQIALGGRKLPLSEQVQKQVRRHHRLAQIVADRRQKA